MVLYGPNPLKNKYFSWLLVIPQNDEKTIPNWISKAMFLDPKWRHEPPRFDLSFDFWSFGAMPKKQVFSKVLRWFKKSWKSSLGAPTGKSLRLVSEGRIRGIWFPGRPPIIKEFQVTNQTNQTNQRKQSDERSTTPMGRRPSDHTSNNYRRPYQ